MIIYQDTVQNFIDQCNEKDMERISEIISRDMYVNGISNFDVSQVRAWDNSLPAIANILSYCDIDKDDVGIAIEYKIRQSRDRIDVLLYGSDEKHNKNVVVIELKQWSNASSSNKRYYVLTNGGHGTDDYWHPSYQAYNYANLMSNFNKYIQDNKIQMSACSYLHNMKNDYSILLEDLDTFPLVKDAPVFLKDDQKKLIDFINLHVKYGDGSILYNIENSKIVPSKHLSDMLISSLEGNDFFSYDETQANAVSEIEREVNDALHYNEKRVIIVKGGPGTGKSVVALNTLGRLISGKNGERRNAIYLTSNAAPRYLYTQELVKNDYTKKAIKNLFKYPTIFKDCGENEYDCVLIDEAHRIFDYKNGVGLKKDLHLFERILKGSRVCVFFIDEDQAVTIDDYVNIETIKKHAENLRIRVKEGKDLELTTQFRILGGEDYITFIKDFLGYTNNKLKYDTNKHYDFKVFDSAKEMMEAIKDKDNNYKNGEKSGKCRLVAGYTHKWISKNKNRESDAYDIVLDNGNFKAKWNLKNKETGANYSWLNDSTSIDEVGCIHTCQGLDLNYCGVIIGKDMTYDGEKIIFHKKENPTTDKASGISRAEDKLAERLIRNTYNVLLTRGMVGTYVYCEDKALSNYLKSLITNGVDK